MDERKSGGGCAETGKARRRREKAKQDGLRGCNTLSGKWENVTVMKQIGCVVALTWSGLCMAER